MEPKNHPIAKENHLPNLHFLGSMLIFQGVCFVDLCFSLWFDGSSRDQLGIVRNTVHSERFGVPGVVKRSLAHLQLHEVSICKKKPNSEGPARKLMVGRLLSLFLVTPPKFNIAPVKIDGNGSFRGYVKLPECSLWGG